MKKILPLFILILIGMGLSSCENIFKKEQKSKEAIFILFDLSESTNKPEIRKMYLESLNTILSKIDHGDVLIYDKITEASLEKSEPKVKDFPVFSAPGEAGIIVKAKKKKADEELLEKKKKIVPEVEDFLVAKGEKGTSWTTILSSLYVAERVFKLYDREKKILVIMSDMIEDSKDYNFKKENLTDKRIEGIIAKEKSRIPDLTGVKVYVVGATAKTTDKYFAIQKFWLRYLTECDASISKENYGTTLLSFE